MRKGNAVPRSILPDPKFNDLNIAKLINMIMLQGKKGLAQRIVYGAFDKVAEKTKKDPYTIFTKAMENVGPSVELKTKRVRGSNFKVPMEVGLKRRTVLSLRWLIESSRDRNEKEMIDRLANELIDASNGVGASVKKKDDMHKTAEANKAFSHLHD